MSRENQLQKIFSKRMQEVQKVYPPVIAAILESIAEGNTISKAVEDGFRKAGYVGNMSDITVGGMIDASGLGLGDQLTLDLNLAVDYYLFTKFSDGVSLSNTLHSGDAQKSVKNVLNNYFRYKGNAQELSKKLSKINLAPKVDINKSVKALAVYRKEFGLDSPEYRRQLNRAIESIKELNKRGVTQTTQLKKAYSKLASIITAPTSNDKQIKKALDYAFKQKVNYINATISRTEFARAYELSFQRQMYENPDIIGFEWELSSAHPRPDICDCYAEADIYGLGAGVYPKDAGVNVPAHPNCLCMKIPVFRKLTGRNRKGRFSEQRIENYIDRQPEYKKRQIVGAANSHYKKDYIKGLTKQGFKITQKPRMVSKTILN